MTPDCACCMAQLVGADGHSSYCDTKVCEHCPVHVVVVESEFKDKAGVPLKAGDIIVYGHALGRCAGLQYGRVLEVRVVVSRRRDEEKIKLRVQGVDSDRGDEPRLLKPGFLEFPERILKVREEQVPEGIWRLLT